MPAVIPQDVVHLILDHFALSYNKIGSSARCATCPGPSCNKCSVRTVRACSRVCKEWQPLCQQRLFKSARLPKATDIHALRTRIRKSPHLAVYITDLDIGDHNRPSMTAAAIYDLPSLSGVQNLTWSIPGDAPRALLAFLPTVLPNVTFVLIGLQSKFHDVVALFDLSRAFPRVDKLTISHLKPYDTFAVSPAQLRALTAPTALKREPVQLRSLFIKDAYDTGGVDLPTLWCARQVATGFRDVRKLDFLNIIWFEQPFFMEPLNALFREVRGSLACLKIKLHSPEYKITFTETVVAPFPAFDLSHNAALRQLEICISHSRFGTKALEGPVALLRSLPMLDVPVVGLVLNEGETLDEPRTWREIIQLFSKPRFGKPCTLLMGPVSDTLPTCVRAAHRALKNVNVDLRIISSGDARDMIAP